MVSCLSFTILSLLSLSQTSSAMAIVSAFTLIRSIALFHITLAYFFLTNPQIVVDQNIVLLLGGAMKLVS